jgi:hypothetical protein
MPFGYYSSALGREIWVPIGRITDLESCPRIPVAYFLFGNVTKRAAVIHDELYRLASVGRGVADAVFYEAMVLSKIPKWRADAIYAGVRFGGESHYGKKHRKPL